MRLCILLFSAPTSCPIFHAPRLIKRANCHESINCKFLEPGRLHEYNNFNNFIPDDSTIVDGESWCEKRWAENQSLTPWEPKTFIFRGYNPYFRDENLHVSRFWGPRAGDFMIHLYIQQEFFTGFRISSSKICKLHGKNSTWQFSWSHPQKATKTMRTV